MSGDPQRPKRTPKADRLVAHHEAGHAVVSLNLRQAFQAVTIEPDTPGTLGAMHQSWSMSKTIDTYSPDGRSRRYIEDRIIIALAGPAAARKFAGRSTFGGEADHDDAVDLLMRLTGDPEELDAYYKLLEIRAKQRVEREWPSIEALAKVLLHERRVTSRRAKEVYRGSVIPIVPQRPTLIDTGAQLERVIPAP